jgi:hypothetical protein
MEVLTKARRDGARPDLVIQVLSLPKGRNLLFRLFG